MSFRARCYRWKTKYQMEGLKDGEWYNMRDGKIYKKYIKIKTKDGFILKEEE